MSDSKVQPETSAECSLRDRVLLALARADGQDWSSIAEASRHTIEIMYGKQADAVLAVRDDVLAEQDARVEQARKTGKHYFDLALTLAEERDTAEAEVARLRETVGRVEALFAGGPDTPCRTTWWGNPGPGLVECVEVPVDDLRAALAPRESATEAPRTRVGEVVDGYLCRHGKYGHEHDCDDHRDRAAGKGLCTCGTCLAIRAARDGERGGERS